MAYVDYNLEINRQGYRPYGRTNPFSATMLNGVGQAQPFTPGGGWRLHGLGQVRPFDPWILHGLGGMVPDQSVVIYQGKWQSTQTKNATDVVNAVVGAIEDDGSLAVRNVSTNVGTIASIAEATWPYPLYAGPFNVTLTIQVQNGQGFGDPKDIISIVRHFVYEITGQFPLADSIPTVTAPAGSQMATGQPPLEDAPPPNGVPVDFATWLENNALWIGLAIGAIAILPPILGRGR